MFPLQKNDNLYRVTTYEFFRENKRLNIEVAFCLSGKIPGIFIASMVCDGCDLSDDFEGLGDSDVAALRDCLSKIQDLSLQQILERGAWSPQTKPAALLV